jgi:hypothetical protein
MLDSSPFCGCVCWIVRRVTRDDGKRVYTVCELQRSNTDTENMRLVMGKLFDPRHSSSFQIQLEGKRTALNLITNQNCCVIQKLLG